MSYEQERARERADRQREYDELLMELDHAIDDHAYARRILSSMKTRLEAEKARDCWRGRSEFETCILRVMPYKRYLATLHWYKVASKAKANAKGKCQLCNSDIDLEAHHRTYENRGAEQPGDVTVLCDKCHGRFHNEPDDEL